VTIVIVVGRFERSSSPSMTSTRMRDGASERRRLITDGIV
jgi:hypothetical protein